MGVDLNCAQLLIRARHDGAKLGRIATLGRQGLHANRPALVSILRKAGYELSADCVRKLLDPTNGYSEAFFGLLGATEITAIDATDYEGAQIIHDMNSPIPDTLAARFDVVFDGGTLEHVFDFPTGIRNALNIVAPSGLFISTTMANNFSGHGFYQFSPELYYRLLCIENGYAIESCIMWEDVQGSRFYRVPDPAVIGTRIELTSRSGTYLFVQARRCGSHPRDYVPQQSDYVRRWEADTGAVQQPGGARGLRSALKSISILRSAVFLARGLRQSGIFRPACTEAEYRRRRLDRNSRGLLVPIEGLKVRL